MGPKKELQLAYGVLIVLLIVGVISYAAIPSKPPDIPLRLMLTAGNGNVFFDHQGHAAIDGYGLACNDCHHELEGDDPEDVVSCSECHDPDAEEGEDPPGRKDAFHIQCTSCHDAYGAGPLEKDCTTCHVM